MGRRLREAAYALSDGPLSLLGLLCLAGCLVIGVALLVVVVGVGLLAVGLIGARAWGRLELARARALLGVRLPALPAAEPAVSSAEWLRAALTDGRGWRAVGYALVKVPVGALTTTVALAGYGGAAAGLSYPAWASADPMVFGSFVLDTPGRITSVALAGLLLLGLTPFVLAGPLAISRVAVVGLLGPSRPGRRLRALEQARGQALANTAAELRRIERDLHDGTQARLVALAMDLGLAREMVATEERDDTLAAVLAAAHRNAQQALAELRGIVSTIHPPSLDAGLGPALEALTEVITVPVSVSVRLRRRPAPSIETIVYYCAAELLGNVVKHSGAGTATVTVIGERRWLTLRVHDDGRGGAEVRHGSPGNSRNGGGTGLAGLVGRVEAVDGSFEVHSPPGGPTTVTVGVPVLV